MQENLENLGAARKLKINNNGQNETETTSVMPTFWSKK